MKRFVWLVFFGALLGGAATSYIAPKAIAWYFEPPITAGNISCKPSIEWALSRLQWAQLLGSFAGGAFGVLLFMAFRPRKGKVDQSTQIAKQG